MNYKKLYINGRLFGFGKHNIFNRWNQFMYFLYRKRNSDLIPIIASLIITLFLISKIFF